MRKTISILLVLIVFILSFMSCDKSNSTIYDDYSNNKVTQQSAKNHFNSTTDKVITPIYEWGFNNCNDWGKALIRIEPNISGDYILNDSKGNYVVIMKDNNIHWSFYPQQQQWITSSVNTNYTLKTSNVNNITILNNNSFSVVTSWESYAINITNRFIINELPIFEITSPDTEYYIPYNCIDTSKEIEFFCEGKTYGTKSYHYYKFYIK